jgi:acyl-coenzyme A synthetase/AMP-(fatty) acid ligase/acyl carrier protein
VWLAVTSPSFDISALELLLPLVVGGRVVVAPDGATRDGPALLRLLAEHGVTHVQATPSGWRLLLAAGFDGPGITALCGGEALPLPLAGELRARVRRLWNMYGPTETTIWSTAWPVPAVPDQVSIGRPLANTRLYVLDERCSPVPVGIAGELYIGGAGLARGYLGRADLTAQRFVAEPTAQRFGADPNAGGRMYRTGDRVRYRPDGTVEYLGRIDNQVKVRGYRIEPAEIEARLLELPGVAEAAVVLRPDADGDGQLLACLVPWPGAGVPAAAAVRTHLSTTLPEYMMPAAVVALDRLPLTANGKLDRTALPDLPPPAMQRDGGAGVPRDGGAGADRADPLTRQVTEICREVLRLDDIGPDDSLFDLGAHSLKMTQIAARIRRRLKVDLSLHVFYADPSVSRLVTAIGEARGRD